MKFWEEWIKIPAQGIANTVFYFRIPFSHNLLYKVFLTVCLLIAVSSSFVVLWSLRRKFQSNVLTFLETDDTSKECPIVEIRDLLTKRKLLEQETKMRAVQEAVIRTYRQVGHDMRSPLSALTVAIDTARNFTGTHKTIADAAIAKLKTMATELLNKGKDVKSEPSSGHQLVNLAEVIQLSIAEKRMELTNKSEITVALETILDDRDLMIQADPIKLQRTISNLINNSIEAIQAQEGKVEVSLVKDEKRARIQIKDNGKGIPANVLSSVGLAGFTYGKRGGHGLGISYAKEVVESIGGELQVQSEEGNGTRVQIYIPLV